VLDDGVALVGEPAVGDELVGVPDGVAPPAGVTLTLGEAVPSTVSAKAADEAAV
jgi:hypothetical protein